jgi:hypothetical protein
MKGIEHAKTELQTAIEAINQALSGSLVEESVANAGDERISRKQLLLFRNNLQQMLNSLTESNSGARISAVSPLGHIIVDSWPNDSELGTIILRAEHLYGDLLTEKES